jgi:hypothetical protein
MTKQKRYKRYSPEFKREALKRTAEEGRLPRRLNNAGLPLPCNRTKGAPEGLLVGVFPNSASMTRSINSLITEY